MSVVAFGKTLVTLKKSVYVVKSKVLESIVGDLWDVVVKQELERGTHI